MERLMSDSNVPTDPPASASAPSESFQEATAAATTATAMQDGESLQSANFPEFASHPPAEMSDQAKHLQLLKNVSLKVKVELGRGKLLLKDILRLTKGSVVE